VREKISAALPAGRQAREAYFFLCSLGVARDKRQEVAAFSVARNAIAPQ